MFPLILITIAAIHLAYPYTASDKFPCTEPDKEAEPLLQLKEATTLWDKTRMNFNTRFSDGRNKARHRLEVEHCWPDDMNGISNAQQTEKRATQKRRQEQRFINCSPRGLKPRYSQLEAEKLLREHPDATWNDFSTNNIQEDVMLQVCSNFLHDVEQIKIELRSMRQELRNLRVELQEHRPNAMKGNYRPWAPNQKEKQKPARFCTYCHKDGNTPKWCRKKIRDEEIRKLQNEMSSRSNHVPNQNHGTNAIDRSAQYDQNVDQSPDSDDSNNPTNEHQLTEEETAQDESIEFTPPGRRSFSRNSGMNFHLAQISSAGESDDKLSDPLPLGYWSHWKPRLYFLFPHSFMFFGDIFPDV